MKPLNVYSMVTTSKARTSQLSAQVLLSTHIILKEPRSTAEALTIPEWKQAMEAEYQALMNNNTWEIVPYEEGMHVVGSKWVFKTKLNSDGSL